MTCMPYILSNFNSIFLMYIFYHSIHFILETLRQLARFQALVSMDIVIEHDLCGGFHHDWRLLILDFTTGIVYAVNLNLGL